MYMMNFINLPVCFITFDDVAVGWSKVSVFWKSAILYTQVAFWLSCCFEAIHCPSSGKKTMILQLSSFSFHIVTMMLITMESL